jgi:hypothetical protein
MLKLSRRSFDTHLETASISVADGEPLTLTFAPGLSVICGGNGAGKSTLLGAIWRCLAGEMPPEGHSIPGVPPWLKSIEIVGGGRTPSWSASFDVAAGDMESQFSKPVIYIDAAAETEHILTQIRSDSQPYDLLEGIDPSPFSKAQIETLSYILRREYSEILVYEITAFSEDEVPLPYFEVVSMGKRYSLLQMGRGELAATYLLWKLDSAAPGSVVLVEEPESHLAAFSQDLLVDAMVSAVVDRELCLIISSHSPGFFQRLPSRNVILVSSLPTPQIRSGLPAGQVARHFGVLPRIYAMILVEDKVAAELLHCLLVALDRDALTHLDIRAVSTGESGVIRIVQDVLRGPQDDVAILGVLDGDQRPKNGQTLDENIHYLVGDSAPEVLLRQVLSRWRNGELPAWTPMLPEGADALRLSLERLDGRDLHDWIFELGREYGGLRRIMTVAVDALLSDDASKEDAIKMIEWLRSRSRLPQ